MNVDEDLEGIRWIHSLGGGRFSSASYSTLFSQTLEKGPLFGTKRDGVFLSSVFYTSAAKYFCIGRLAGARHVSPAVL